VSAADSPTGSLTPVVTVVQLDAAVPLDRFADHLDGVDVRLVRAYAGEQPGADDRLDGLIVLGGNMSAHDEHEPGIPETRALLADAARAGVPTLGICLGAQLLAVATGGRVDVAAPPGREAGVVDVRWRPEAAADPLLGPLAADAERAGTRSTPMPTMHADAVVDLPRNATWLAASRTYPYQAFRIGDAAWGLQFHPEASPGLMAAWSADAGDAPEEQAAIAEAVTAADDVVQVEGARIARAFAGIVAVRAAERTAA